MDVLLLALMYIVIWFHEKNLSFFKKYFQFVIVNLPKFPRSNRLNPWIIFLQLEQTLLALIKDLKSNLLKIKTIISSGRISWIIANFNFLLFETIVFTDQWSDFNWTHILMGFNYIGYVWRIFALITFKKFWFYWNFITL